MYDVSVPSRTDFVTSSAICTCRLQAVFSMRYRESRQLSAKTPLELRSIVHRVVAMLTFGDFVIIISHSHHPPLSSSLSSYPRPPIPRHVDRSHSLETHPLTNIPPRTTHNSRLFQPSIQKLFCVFEICALICGGVCFCSCVDGGEGSAFGVPRSVYCIIASEEPDLVGEEEEFA